jgi:hypothetical protein
MPPSKFLILLVFLTFLGLPLASAAEEEIASAADVALLEEGQQRLQGDFDERIRTRIDVVMEDLEQPLAMRTTRHLQRALHAGRGHASPAARRAFASDGGASPASHVGEGGGDTVCTMVGHTLECVLRAERL